MLRLQPVEGEDSCLCHHHHNVITSHNEINCYVSQKRAVALNDIPVELLMRDVIFHYQYRAT